MEWFGHPSNGPVDDERQFDRVRDVIANSRIDLWALQEISDPDDFARLLAELGSDFDGVLATESVEQRIAFVYRKDVVRPAGVSAARHILVSSAYDFAFRPPLLLEASVQLPDTTFSATFVTVHMKAFSDATSYERRDAASRSLKNYLDFLLPRTPVIVLGDFNDTTVGSITAGRVSPYQEFVLDDGDYRFLSTSLETERSYTYCSNSSCTIGSTIDHVLVTDEWFDLVPAGACFRLVTLLDAFSSYVATTSDHLPVVARFHPDPAAVAAESDAPGRLVRPVLDAYPNPVRKQLHLHPSGARSGERVQIEIFDALGRRISVRSGTGAETWTVDTSGWTPGLYVARMSASTTTRIATFVKEP